jgi:threonylcarbamoyladenosine tRNA methylthiotransferase MtaB
VSKKIAFKTLGCRLNQFETDALASEFHRNGYEVVGFNKEADVYVVNTCTVTNQSDHKSRHSISKASRKSKDSILVVTGCMADNYKNDLELQENISYVVKNDQKSSIFHLIDAHFKGEIHTSDSFEKDKFGFGIADKGFHTRSMIKIQDGCDNFCSYCIVPKVRGRAVSRPFAEIEKNIREVVNIGFKEIVLTGVNIGRYKDEGIKFENLIEKILDIPGDFRVRISSMEPDGFGDRFFDLFDHPKLTPHLHLCLQSGSEKILQNMRRMYSVKEFIQMAEKLKSKHADFNLTTDIIVGFPGETEDDFQETCRISREIEFSHIHTFKYSVRNGTKAAHMEDQVPEKIKTERSRIIRDISLKNRLAYFEKMTGKEQIVLTERPKSGIFRGYGENYIPVNIKGELKRNQFVKVKLKGIKPGDEPEMTGERLNLSYTKVSVTKR